MVEMTVTNEPVSSEYSRMQAQKKKATGENASSLAQLLWSLGSWLFLYLGAILWCLRRFDCLHITQLQPLTQLALLDCTEILCSI